MVSLGQAVKKIFTHYFDFKGVATRAEFWWMIIVRFVLGVVIEEITWWTFFSYGEVWRSVWSLVVMLISLLVFIPSISLNVRRNRDTDMLNVWIWTLNLIVPIFVFLLGFVMDGDNIALLLGLYLLVFLGIAALPTNFFSKK